MVKDRRQDTQAFAAFRRALNRGYATGIATEHTYRPAMQALIQHFAGRLVVINEATRHGGNAPDLVVVDGSNVVGHIECKDIGKSLDAIETDSELVDPKTRDGEQLRRYRFCIENLLVTDHLELRRYVRGRRRGPSVKFSDISRINRIIAIKGQQVGAGTLIQDFCLTPLQSVVDPSTLAERMARYTRQLRDDIVRMFEQGRGSDHVNDIKDAFKQSLLPRLSDEEFADMFSQTLAYGLFASRLNRTSDQPFRRQDAARDIPRSNPLLRRVFEAMAGTQLDDEPFAPIIDELASLLANADMNAILKDFGEQTATQDPVLHFYETFLNAYDPKLREQRGVYYTPEPVVSYIVRSVDRLLVERFDCADGLADGSRTSFNPKANGELDQAREVPRVLILDPACGTGTFLHAIVRKVHDRVARKGLTGAWEDYVADELLPRLFGFELLMAPYTVAHLKLWHQLISYTSAAVTDAASGTFQNQRFGIYLANALDEPSAQSQQLSGAFRVISEEAHAAAEIKRDLPIMVIIGNPPYSGHSANRGAWIRNLLRGHDGNRKVANYFAADGAPIDEPNSKWLNDDYVKFIRFAQWKIHQSGSGILAFITNHSWIDNPTFRGMRDSLLKDFDEIFVYDLHGNSRLRQEPPDGIVDENVFDIQQGTAISIFIKTPRVTTAQSKPAKVRHAELWGTREDKYRTLDIEDVSTTKWSEITPQSPYYLFRPHDTKLVSEYDRGWRIDKIFKKGSAGVVTARDTLNVHHTEERVVSELYDFVNQAPQEARERFELGDDVEDWKLDWALADVRKHLGQDGAPDRRRVVKYSYRPFDTRYVFYTGKTRGLMCRPRHDISGHMLAGENLAMCVGRAGAATGSSTWDVVYSSTNITDFNLFRRGGNRTFPLYLYPTRVLSSGTAVNGVTKSNGVTGDLEDVKADRVANFNVDFVRELAGALDMQFAAQPEVHNFGLLGPDAIFQYIYALLHSPSYRNRYSEYLMIDFPRIPLTSNRNLFGELRGHGQSLLGLHTGLDAPEWITRYPIQGTHVVESLEYEPQAANFAGRMNINSTQYFEGVPREVSHYTIGGYNPALRWLQDRQGQTLDLEDIRGYMNLVASIRRTIDIQTEVDATINKHGGWPIDGR